MPHDLARWSHLRLRRDIIVGSALVAVFGISVLATAGRLGPANPRPAYLIAAAAFGSAVLVCLAAARFPHRAVLLGFPAVVSAALGTLALCTDGIAATYIGFLSLSMMYVGLTQPRRMVPIWVAILAPCWLVCQEAVSAATFVRLTLTVIVWCGIGLALASRGRREQAEAQRLVLRANTDTLTGLASREALQLEVERELATERLVGSKLLLLDLDGFKAVNDMFGHAAGDELLVEVAGRMAAVMRPTDVLARVGGDEFAALLRESDMDRAKTIAARLLGEIARPVALGRARMAVTASIGIADVHGATNANQAMHEADLAMYDAKQGGRNGVAAFERTMADRRDARERLESDLSVALDRGEFELYYQPAVHLVTGEVVGVEALLRWNHPERGTLTPDQFLGAAERMGVITALGDWVLQRACEQAVRWQPSDPARALTMAINVSGPELLSTSFVERLTRVLAVTGLRSHFLVLEVSSRLLISDAPLIRDRIQRLRELGVRIAIDDFGAGSASLAELGDLPVDILKIDASFTGRLGMDRGADAIVRAIIVIAGALDLDLIAEGIEAQQHIDLVASLGCHVGQGYFVARPGSAATIEPLLKRRLAQTRLSAAPSTHPL